METAVCVAVLAHGEADAVDQSTFYRIEKAIERLRVLRDDGKETLALLCMAGVGKKASSLTLATRMARVAGDMLRNGGLSDVRVLYNHIDRRAWGTIREMRWALQEAQHHYSCPTLEYVTNARHARRVAFTSWLLQLGPCTTVISEDNLSPLHHEILAYLKLSAYALGCEAAAECVRSRYSGG